MEPPYNTLIIDDEEDLRDLLEHMLEGDAFTIETASSGREGLAVLESNEDETDLVILDLSMPDIGGFETLNEIRSLGNPPLTVILSSTDSEEYQIRAFESGAVDYVTKPFNPVVLIARLKRHLRREPDRKYDPLSSPWVSGRELMVRYSSQ